MPNSATKTWRRRVLATRTKQEAIAAEVAARKDSAGNGRQSGQWWHLLQPRELACGALETTTWW
jgi:hypothetical protein